MKERVSNSFEKGTGPDTKVACHYVLFAKKGEEHNDLSGGQVIVTTVIK